MPELNVSGPQQPTAAVATTKNRINWKNILLGIIIGAILVGIIAITFWYFTRPKESETSPVTTTKTSTSSAKPATTSAQKDETADWKVYKDKSFTFKYPQDVKQEVGTHGNILLTSGDKIMVNIALVSFENGYSEYVKNYSGLTKGVELTVDDHQATQISYEEPLPQFGVAIVINKNGREGVQLNLKESDLPTVKKMLSTFKFL